MAASKDYVNPNAYENKNPNSNKKEINKNNEEPYVKPVISGTMEHLKDESVMLFSYSIHNHKRYRMFYAIGTVYRVVKGDKQDLLYMNFGLFKERKTRLVVVYDNHSRRQLLTLKRGQICQVYGLCRYFTTDIMLNGKKTKGIRLGLYAKGINAWYVPTMFDLRKMPTNEDLSSPTEKEVEIQETLEDVLNEFLNGTGDEE